MFLSGPLALPLAWFTKSNSLLFAKRINILSIKISVMNLKVFTAFLLLLVLSACTPPQQVLSSWVNREALPKKPYKSIFVMSLTRDWQNRLYIENEMAKLIAARGQKAVKSSDVLTPAFMGSDLLTIEILVKAVRQ